MLRRGRGNFVVKRAALVSGMLGEFVFGIWLCSIV
jgi:hypothetical protein